MSAIYRHDSDSGVVWIFRVGVKPAMHCMIFLESFKIEPWQIVHCDIKKIDKADM